MNIKVKKEDILKNSIESLPNKPGIYQFYDNSGKLLYIGKAKNLKKRVSSYFNRIRYETNKIRILVNKISSLQHIVVDSESDALLLENNLIKKYQPKYNVNLKDDKTFPWICITNERFPRVFSTRNIIDNGSKYYGPYTSALTVKTLLSLVKQLYKLRTCKLQLSDENIKKGKFKICLEYHIGNCKGPCEGLQSEEDYNRNIQQIQQILKGNLKEVIDFLKQLMLQFSTDYKFEEAQNVKQKIDLLEKFQTKSTIVNTSIHDVDVFSIIEDSNYAYVNFLKVSNGAIIQAHSVELQKKLEETKEELLEFAITEIRSRLFSSSKEIIVPFKLNIIPAKTIITIPIKGDKKKLLDLSERNAKYFLLERKKQKANISPEKSISRVLNTLKVDLRMTEIPYHIECFDNSNIQGSDPVASCVVFINAKPVKKEYRHYNIKLAKGQDDFASMGEIVSRRYTRTIEEKNNLPQLIVIDGGKGQLNAAVESLEKLNIRGKIAIIGIAKRLEEIYFPDDPVPLYIDKNSESLKIIQKIRNEAHRFGVSFHRQKRSGSMMKSELNSLPGFGSKTILKIWTKFTSLDEMKNASMNEFEEILGKRKAIILKSYLNTIKTNID